MIHRCCPDNAISDRKQKMIHEENTEQPDETLLVTPFSTKKYLTNDHGMKKTKCVISHVFSMKKNSAAIQHQKRYVVAIKGLHNICNQCAIRNRSKYGLHKKHHSTKANYPQA